jgi:hypothetical protein
LYEYADRTKSLTLEERELSFERLCDYYLHKCRMYLAEPGESESERENTKTVIEVIEYWRKTVKMVEKEKEDRKKGKVWY